MIRGAFVQFVKFVAAPSTIIQLSLRFNLTSTLLVTELLDDSEHARSLCNELDAKRVVIDV
jgi:hypothetical protein